MIEYKGLQKMIAEKLSVGIEQVLPDSNLMEELGGDSLDMVDLIMTCEEEYGIEIPDNTATGLYTPQLIFDYLRENYK
ncbi:MAG: acyl carrier protein [Nanoarchaeota archaeon]|nr:acyl carrier protein [Nanoarchaeota archaeon]MCK5630014.1 acyl carrier protein [Nanoarchaeota archaeon]